VKNTKGAKKYHKKRLVDLLVYNPTMQNDTIAAIATPPGIGGIGVIRVSGPEAFAFVHPLVRQPGGRTDIPPSHLLTYGQIVDPATGAPADETWRTVTVPAASCVDANTAATAAMMATTRINRRRRISR